MWTVLTTQLAGFEAHAGEFEEARQLATAALPRLWELGAVDDHCQTRASLALIALHQSRVEEAEQILDEVEREESSQSVFGGGMSVACGRAEALLARHDVQGGLRAYSEAVLEMQQRTIPGLALPDGLEPWVIFPEAALLAANVRHGQRAQRTRDALLAKLRDSAFTPGVIDIPVFGCALFALGSWEASYGDEAAGAALLAFADRFAFSRLLPSFDWGWAITLVTPADIGVATPQELREPIHALLTQLC